MKENKINITDPWGFSYHIELVGIQKAKELIHQFEGKQIDEWTKEQSEKYVYRLNDGRILVTSYADATIYSSLDGFLSNLQTSGSYIQKRVSNQYPIKAYTYALDKRRIAIFRLTNEDAAIIKMGAKEIDGPRHKATFLTRNGEVLQIRTLGEEDPLLFLSLEDYQAANATAAKMSRIAAPKVRQQHSDVAEMVFGKNPYGQDFPDHKKEIIGRLPELINCPEKLLDFELHSLNSLNRFLFLQVFNADLSEQIFLPLLAYVGEVHVRNKGGKWVMRHDTYMDQWYPDIKDADGKQKNLYYIINRLVNPNDTHMIKLQETIDFYLRK